MQSLNLAPRREILAPRQREILAPQKQLFNINTFIITINILVGKYRPR